MNRLAIALLGCCLAIPAFAQPAQQPADPAFLQKAITALQEQRNAAQDNAAVLGARLQILADEKAKLEARMQELEKAAKETKP